MIDFEKLPLMEPPAAAMEELEHGIIYDTMNEGRAARAAGVKIDKCPPYRREDMAQWWRTGWIYENEDRKWRKRNWGD
jgi:hypothetical protein